MGCLNIIFYSRKNKTQGADPTCINIHRGTAKIFVPELPLKNHPFNEEILDKFGEACDKNTDTSNLHDFKEDRPQQHLTRSPFVAREKSSILHSVPTHTKINPQRCFLSLASNFKVNRQTSLLLQLVLLIIAIQYITPCIAQKQQLDEYQYYPDSQPDVSQEDLQKLYQLYDYSSTASGMYPKVLKLLLVF